MPTDLAARLDRLEAVEAVRASKMRYARWCDAGFPTEGLPELFTPGCTWDGGEVFGRHTGQAELEAFFAGARASAAWALHYIVSGTVEVAPDLRSADSTWYLWQPMTLDGTPVWHMGRYDDHHVRTDDGWRIAELRLTVEALTPIDVGWVAERYLARS